jgi:SAM-dependent methyltransferase
MVSTAAQLRALGRRVVERVGLMGVYLRALEWKISQEAENPPATAPDGLPLPDRYLITLVAGTGDWRWYQQTGEEAANAFAAFFAQGGKLFETAARVLDFGCGVGRIARHVAPRVGGEFFGVDYNPRLVRWCAANLPGKYVRNSLLPPLPFPDAHFDVLFAYSVFTHLSIESQRLWVPELARVTAPGGVALITLHDEEHVSVPQTTEARAAFAAEGAFVLNEQIEGSNFAATFQTRAHAARILSEGFEVLQIAP